MRQNGRFGRPGAVQMGEEFEPKGISRFKAVTRFGHVANRGDASFHDRHMGQSPRIIAFRPEHGRAATDAEGVVTQRRREQGYGEFVTSLNFHGTQFG